MDSNHRPHAYQACALATWATDRFFFSGFFSSLHRADLVSRSLSKFFQTVRTGFWTFNSTSSSWRISLGLQLQQFSLYGACTVNRKLVEMKGFEPLTPCLQGRCSPNWATPPFVWVFLKLFWLKPDNWTTKSIRTKCYTHLPRFFVLIWLRGLKYVSRI